MSKMRYILAACMLIGCSIALSAQTFETVSRRNPWNASRNAAGIRQDTLSRSYAEIYGRYEDGEFRDTWQAPEGWSAGAITRSIRHSGRISFAGSFSFEQTEGYEMCGSMFMKPGYFPIDVLEFTPGRKTMQTYALEGGVSYDISERWRIGADIDFESANLSKRKDLRHSNWYLDMNLAPGFMYVSDTWSLGAAAVFVKTSETIDAEQVGTAESSYYAFLDKGLMYGVNSVWTGSGVHLDEAGVNGLPVKEYSYGPSIQFQYRNLYIDAELLGTIGSIGEKEYIWFDYSGLQSAASARYDLKREKSEHRFGVDFSWKSQDVDENVLEKVTVNGVTTVVGHGFNRMYSRERWTVSPEYEYLSEKVELRTSVSVDMENGLTSQIYPYVHTRSLIALSAETDVLVHLGPFDLGVKLGYGEGWMTESSRQVSAGQMPQEGPFRLQDWNDRHMDYITAPRMASGLSLRYNFVKGLYVEASGRWIRSFRVGTLAGPDRFASAIKLGYIF